MMTPTDKDLIEWSAKTLMGWKSATVKVMDATEVCNAWAEEVGPDNIIYHWKKYFDPLDKSNGQIWDCVERMRGLGYMLYLIGPVWEAKWIFIGDTRKDGSLVNSDNPRRAILLAAWRAVEGT